MKERTITISLIIACIFFMGVSVLIYLGQDHKAPQISINTQEKITYTEGDDESTLLKGVSAKDNRDGDVTKQVFVDRIISVGKKKAVVYYAVMDKKNNVGVAKRKITYLTADESSDSEDGQNDSAEDSGQAEVSSPNTDTESPSLTLTAQSKTIKTGESFDPSSMVVDVTDDKDDKNTLYRHLFIDGNYDVNTAGTYEINYYVTDRDNHTSEPVNFTLIVQ